MSDDPTHDVNPLPSAEQDEAIVAEQQRIIDAEAEADRASFDQLSRLTGDDPRLNDDGIPYARPLATISEQICDHYLRAEQIPLLRRLSPASVRDGLLGRIVEAVERQNRDVKDFAVAGTKLRVPTRLGHTEVARLVAALCDVILLAPSDMSSDPDLNVLAVYEDDPTSAYYGTYRASNDRLDELFVAYQPDLTTKESAEIAAALRRRAPVRTRGDNPDLIACRNGIVDYNGGDPKFMKFSPEHIFLAKLDVDWNEEATNPILPNPEGCIADHEDPAECSDECLTWDVESWMHSLSDDPEVVNLLWEVIGATVRPYVSWNKAAFFFSTEGNNGKGTLLELMRNILGVGAYASVPLADFGKDYMLEPLTRASAILVDENDVGTFLDKAANFKAIVTNDVITINRKYKAPIAHQHFGFMVQCLNDKPLFKDKSESIYRRQTFIPFTKTFTGRERKYIKDDYLKRSDVLEYVLKRVLNMSYYALSEPLAVQKALDEFREYNDPVRAFWNEIKTQLYWDLVPFTFAYDLYNAWMGRNMPNSRPIGRNKFIDELVALITAEPEGPWECKDHTAKHRPGSRMMVTEPLIFEFDLVKWADESKRNDPNGYATMPAAKLKANYSGLRRKAIDLSGAVVEQAEEPAETDEPGTGTAAEQDTDVYAPGASGRVADDPFAVDGGAGSGYGPAIPADTDDSAGPETEPDGPDEPRRPSPAKAAALAANGIIMADTTDEEAAS